MIRNILKISDLNVTFRGASEEFTAVDNFSLEIKKGETIAIVGESGSGKSTTALSILGLLPYPIAHHNKGSIKFKNTELLNADSKKLQKYRGSKIGMIFQEPMMSLNPLHTVNKQIQESILIHNKTPLNMLKKRVKVTFMIVIT